MCILLSELGKLLAPM